MYTCRGWLSFLLLLPSAVTDPCVADSNRCGIDARLQWQLLRVSHHTPGAWLCLASQSKSGIQRPTLTLAPPLSCAASSAHRTLRPAWRAPASRDPSRSATSRGICCSRPKHGGQRSGGQTCGRGSGHPLGVWRSRARAAWTREWRGQGREGAAQLGAGSRSPVVQRVRGLQETWPSAIAHGVGTSLQACWGRCAWAVQSGCG